MNKRCALRVARCGLRVVICGLWVARCGLRGIGYSLLAARCSVLDARCWMLDTGCSMLDTRQLLSAALIFKALPAWDCLNRLGVDRLLFIGSPISVLELGAQPIKA